MTFEELLAAYRADRTADHFSPLTDIAHVASLTSAALDAYGAEKVTLEDKAVLGPLVLGLADHSKTLTAKAAAAAKLDEDVASVRASLVPPAPETPPAPTPEPAHVAASTPPVVPGAIGTPPPAPTNAAPEPTARVASFKAAANTDQPMGSDLTDAQLGEMLAEAGHLLGQNGGGVVKVASMVYIDPACPGISADQAAGKNTAILKDATKALLERNRNGKVAAANAYAGFAGPAEYKREIPFVSESMRPLAAALRRVPIKGIIKHYRSAGLSTFEDGATVWTVSDQQSVDPDTASTWKPVSVLTAQNSEVTVTPYAIWGGLEFDIFQEMSAPERVDEAKKLLGVNLARTGEKQLLDTLITLGGTIGTSSAPVRVQLGAYRGFFEILETILTDYGYAERQMTENWRTVFPYGFERVMSIDKRNGQYGDSGLGKSDIDAELRKIGLGAGVYALDDPTIAATRPLVAPFVGGSTTMAASTTNTDATVTVTSTATLQTGMLVTGTGIPAGTYIDSITNATTFELSQAASATGTPTLTFANAAKQYKPLGLRKWPITIFDPASVFMGQRGILTAAVETDATLNRQNRRRYRLEDMEAVGRDGVNAPLTIWVQLAPSGTAAIDITYATDQADFSTT